MVGASLLLTPSTNRRDISRQVADSHAKGPAQCRVIQHSSREMSLRGSMTDSRLERSANVDSGLHVKEACPCCRSKFTEVDPLIQPHSRITLPFGAKLATAAVPVARR